MYNVMLSTSEDECLDSVESVFHMKREKNSLNEEGLLLWTLSGDNWFTIMPYEEAKKCMREIFSKFRMDLTMYPTVLVNKDGETVELNKEWLDSRIDELNYIRDVKKESLNQEV